jgi:hypothetical protein
MYTMRLPNFIGIGAPKSGTTWLFHCLQEHPDIFVAAVKETNFFDYDTITGRLPEYAAHFTCADRYQAVGEISTRYLISPHAPQRIRAYLPTVRLLATLRHPVEQIYSHYWHLCRQNFHQRGSRNLPRSFEEALDIYEARLFEPALYAKHLERWLHHFNPSQLLVLFYDDIRDRPREVLRQIYSYLGVNTTFIPPSLSDNGARMRRGASPRHALLGRLYTVLYDRMSRPLYRRCKQLIGSRRMSALKEHVPVHHLLEQFFLRPGYPAMHPETRASLQARFTADIQHLERFTGRDLSHWCDHHATA